MLTGPIVTWGFHTKINYSSLLFFSTRTLFNIGRCRSSGVSTHYETRHTTNMIYDQFSNLTSLPSSAATPAFPGDNISAAKSIPG